MNWQRAYLDRFYRTRPGWTDGTEDFFALCTKQVKPGARILEIGPGPDNPVSRFLAHRGELHGADVDREAAQNPSLRSLGIIEEERVPFGDGEFDACVSNYVLEHVRDPARHLGEVRRVLRPGGVYVFRTPNRWHYVTLGARLTPQWVHVRLANRLRALPPEAHDPYPTLYRLNSRSDIRRSAALAGLETLELRMIEKEPSYGLRARPLFLAFMAYERLVNASPVLAGLRVNILGVLRRTGGRA